MNGSKTCSRAVRLGVATFLCFGCCLLGSGEGFARPQFGLGAAKQKNKHDEPPPASKPQIDKSITVARAIRTIETDLQQANRGDTELCVKREPLQQIKVTKDGFQYIDTGKRDRGFWKDDYSVAVSFRFKDMAYLQLAPMKRGGGMYVVNWPTPVMTPRPGNFISVCVGGVTTGDLAGFVAAMNRLIWENSAEAEQSRRGEELAFEQKAAEWRAMPDKPAMPENAREHKILAENAVQEKNFDKAIDEYETALKVFPTWPEGQFNLALLYGETGEYGGAVQHMQAYLALVPDAPDAQAAKDKVLIWRDKLAHP